MPHHSHRECCRCYRCRVLSCRLRWVLLSAIPSDALCSSPTLFATLPTLSSVFKVPPPPPPPSLFFALSSALLMAFDSSLSRTLRLGLSLSFSCCHHVYRSGCFEVLFFSAFDLQSSFGDKRNSCCELLCFHHILTLSIDWEKKPTALELMPVFWWLLAFPLNISISFLSRKESDPMP